MSFFEMRSMNISFLRQMAKIWNPPRGQNNLEHFPFIRFVCLFVCFLWGISIHVKRLKNLVPSHWCVSLEMYIWAFSQGSCQKKLLTIHLFFGMCFYYDTVRGVEVVNLKIKSSQYLKSLLKWAPLTELTQKIIELEIFS